MKSIFLIILILFSFELIVGEIMKNNTKLTKKEERVIIHKGTEPPFSGKFTDFSEKGTYLCKRCGAKLYHSTDKFQSSCGWPSFDDEIEGAIRKQPDADGTRTEILCANCGAHLGHLFKGEGYTEKNVRHCVNSISMNFEPDKSEHSTAKAYFAGGCFWGVEYYFENKFKYKQAIDSVVSGFMGGSLDNPSYYDVVYGKTGHREVVEIRYDPSQVQYETLARYFFEIHDPTQENGQGPDFGEQYQSVIFYQNEAEKKIAEKLISILETKGFQIATKLLPATTFWQAEAYHQDYYNKTGKVPYCHAYKKRF